MVQVVFAIAMGTTKQVFLQALAVQFNTTGVFAIAADQLFLNRRILKAIPRPELLLVQHIIQIINRTLRAMHLPIFPLKGHGLRPRPLPPIQVIRPKFPQIPHFIHFIRKNILKLQKP